MPWPRRATTSSGRNMRMADDVRLSGKRSRCNMTDFLGTGGEMCSTSWLADRQAGSSQAAARAQVARAYGFSLSLFLFFRSFVLSFSSF